MTEFERLKELAATGLLTPKDINQVAYSKSEDLDTSVIKLIFLAGQRSGSDDAFAVLNGEKDISDLKKI